MIWIAQAAGALVALTLCNAAALAQAPTLNVRVVERNGPTQVDFTASGLGEARSVRVRVAPEGAPDGLWRAEDVARARGGAAQGAVFVGGGGGFEARLFVDGAETPAARVAFAIGAQRDPDPCVVMETRNPDSVAACLTALRDAGAPAATRFRDERATCPNLQAVVTTARLEAIGAEAAARFRNEPPPFPAPDCAMIAALADSIFERRPAWRGCVGDELVEATPPTRIACVESYPVSAGDARSFLDMRYPQTCAAMRSRLVEAYGAVHGRIETRAAFDPRAHIPGLAARPTTPAAPAAPSDAIPGSGTFRCDDYRAYLDGNADRRRIAEREIDAQQAQARTARAANIDIPALVTESFLANLDAMSRQALASVRETPHPTDEIYDPMLRRALVSALHRMVPENSARFGPVTAELSHTTGGLRSRSRAGARTIDEHYGVRAARILDCAIPRPGVAECRFALTMAANVAASGGGGEDTLVEALAAVSGGGTPRTREFTASLRHDGLQWTLAEASVELVTFLLPPADATAAASGPDYSPEECLWLQSLGAGGVC